MNIIAIYQGKFVGLDSYLSGDSPTLKHFPLPLYMLERFVELGEKVHLICIHDEEITVEKNGLLIYTYSVPKIRFRFIPSTINTIKQIKLALKIAQKTRFDLVYAMGARASFAGFVVSRRLNIPLVIRLWGTFLYFLIISGKNYIKAIFNHLPEILSFVLPKAGLSITNDGTKGDIVASYFGIPKDNLLFEINGLQSSYFNEPQRKPDKKSLGIPENSFVMLVVARLVNWKGVEKIIKLMPKIIAKVPNAYLLVVGDGPMRDNLFNLAKKTGAEKRVKFLGSIEHNRLIEIYDLADIFISFQKYSNLSNAMLESLARGKCVITLDDGSLDELLGKEKYKIAVFTRENELESSIAELIFWLAKDPQNREFYEKNAKQFALQHIPTLEERAKKELDFLYKAVENFVKNSKQKI